MADTVTVLDDSGNSHALAPDKLYQFLAASTSDQPITVLADDGTPTTIKTSQLQQHLIGTLMPKPPVPTALAQAPGPGQVIDPLGGAPVNTPGHSPMTKVGQILLPLLAGPLAAKAGAVPSVVGEPAASVTGGALKGALRGGYRAVRDMPKPGMVPGLVRAGLGGMIGGVTGGPGGATAGATAGEALPYIVNALKGAASGAKTGAQDVLALRSPVTADPTSLPQTVQGGPTAELLDALQRQAGMKPFKGSTLTKSRLPQSSGTGSVVGGAPRQAPGYQPPQQDLTPANRLLTADEAAAAEAARVVPYPSGKGTSTPYRPGAIGSVLGGAPPTARGPRPQQATPETAATLSAPPTDTGSFLRNADLLRVARFLKNNATPDQLERLTPQSIEVVAKGLGITGRANEAMVPQTLRLLKSR